MQSPQHLGKIDFLRFAQMQLRDPAQLAPEFSRHPFGRENQDRSRFRGIGLKNLQLTVDLAFVGNDHAQRRLNLSAFESRCF